ncbi:MAG: Lrp/AsnC family transcriptional regulator [Pseudomonadota bacterium]
MAKPLDKIDRSIIDLLERDARASLAQIGKTVGLTGPAVGERLRRMRDSGQLGGFVARVDLAALGYPIQALVRVKPHSGQLWAVERMIRDERRFVSCDRVTGDDCYVARLVLAELAELDEILSALHERAETTTSLVKSSIFADRLPPPKPSV